MKKNIKILIFILYILISITSCAYADENTSLILAEVTSSYNVFMPSSISIPYNNSHSIDCNLDFSDVLLEDGDGLEVTIEHNNFINTQNSIYQLPYTTDFSKTIITETNRRIHFKIYLDEFYLSILPAGRYNSKITVIIKYVKL